MTNDDLQKRYDTYRSEARSYIREKREFTWLCMRERRELEIQLAEKDAGLVDLQVAIEDARTEVGMGNAYIQDLRKELAEKDAEIQRYAPLVAAAEAICNARHSFTCRAEMPLHAVGKALAALEVEDGNHL